MGIATRKGARSNPDPAGPNFYKPTLLVEVSSQMEIAQSEIFGPVTTAIRFHDEAEAIRIANETL